MTLYTENLNGGNQLTITMEQLLRYVKTVDRDNLKIVFDVGHCHRMVGAIYQEVVKAGDLLKHLHIHDNHGTGDEHLPVGEGTLDFEEFVRGLKAVEYSGLYMMELYQATSENLKRMP